MRKTIAQTVTVMGGILIAFGVGVTSAPAEAPTIDAPAPGPIHVSIVYEESGEARSVGLTDSGGLDIPVGSLAEEWPHLEHDYSEEN